MDDAQRQDADDWDAARIVAADEAIARARAATRDDPRSDRDSVIAEEFGHTFPPILEEMRELRRIVRDGKRRKRRRFRLFSILALVALLLVAPSRVLGVQWEPGSWPGETSILVRDFTQPRIWKQTLARQVALWNPLLQGGSTLTYVREGAKACPSLGVRDQRFDIPRNEIWVCGKRGIGGYGTSWPLVTIEGEIRNALIRLDNGDATSRRERYRTVCHELGHAFGIEHSRSKHSCVSNGHPKTKPGRHDRATMAASFLRVYGSASAGDE